MEPYPNLPNTFFCPLTQTLLVDPVEAADGYTYEKQAIETWFKTNTKSPITGKPISLTLIPNRALKDAIDFVRSKIPLDQQKRDVRKEIEQTLLTEPLSLNVTANNEYTLLQVVPTEGNARIGCDVCCVVDTSGSMGSEATLKSLTGDVESHGLSILDVVKHAVKTIIHNLTASDRLALVSFDSKAKVEMDLTSMDEKGRKKMLDKLATLDPDGSTNLWDGLQTGLDLLKKKAEAGKSSTLFLLTDGEPYIIPPEGHIPALKKYKNANPNLACTINTFGFGYDLDSALLNEIAVEGHGSYSFIPDSSFVGTIFVNALTNLLTSVASEVTLTIEPLHGTKIHEKGVLGGFPQSNGTIILGSVRYGQTRDVVLRTSVPSGDAPYLRATLTYHNHISQKPVKTVVEATRRENTQDIEIQCHRLHVVESLHTAISLNNPKSALDVICQIIEEIDKSPLKSQVPFLEDLLKDLQGQTTEALSNEEAWRRWGRHFLPSLAGAHLQQQCNNFKDFGVQHYAGKLFTQIRDQVEDTFLKLPAPVSSLAPQAPPVNMAAYYNVGGGCIEGHCIVITPNGNSTQIKDIKKGDFVSCSKGTWSRVLCVVKTTFEEKTVDLVRLQGGFMATPFHPVFINGKWSFPIELAPVITSTCEAVYDFVLEGEHVMVVNGVECVTLGHHLVGDVVSHPYFGTERVVRDLSQMKGWDVGLVELKGGNGFIRNDTTGLVCGVRQEIVVV